MLVTRQGNSSKIDKGAYICFEGMYRERNDGNERKPTSNKSSKIRKHSGGTRD